MLLSFSILQKLLVFNHLLLEFCPNHIQREKGKAAFNASLLFYCMPPDESGFIDFIIRSKLRFFVEIRLLQFQKHVNSTLGFSQCVSSDILSCNYSFLSLSNQGVHGLRRYTIYRTYEGIGASEAGNGTRTRAPLWFLYAGNIDAR